MPATIAPSDSQPILPQRDRGGDRGRQPGRGRVRPPGWPAFQRPRDRAARPRDRADAARPVARAGPGPLRRRGGRRAGSRPANGYCWVVDPHDGTRAFLEGKRGSAVSIALLRHGTPILAVVYAPTSPRPRSRPDRLGRRRPDHPQRRDRDDRPERSANWRRATWCSSITAPGSGRFGTAGRARRPGSCRCPRSLTGWRGSRWGTGSPR